MNFQSAVRLSKKQRWKVTSVDVLNRRALRIEVAPEKAREPVTRSLLTEKRVQLATRTHVILSRPGPGDRVDGAVDQSHQQRRRDSFAGNVSQNKSCAIFGNM